MSTLQDIRLSRLDKIKKLIATRGDAYPQPDLFSKNSCLQAQEMKDQTVTVAGRLMSLRGHGKIIFADLVDRTGKIQLFFQEKELKEAMVDCQLLDMGDIISASGTVFVTSAGEITVNVSAFSILAKNIHPLPEKWHGLTDVEERYRQRHVDLIVNPEVRRVFETRTRILSTMRQFLDDHGFMEVETPILQPIYGGASAKPFTTHHNQLDQEMYLRISDELYLKRLIVGGFEKVYEVSRDFRNEGVSRFHNPEFTQIEFYWAYVDYDRLMKFTEELISHTVTVIHGQPTITFQGQKIDFAPPYKRLTFRDAIFEKTNINIDLITSEKEFIKEIKKVNLKVDITGIVGLGACFDALYKEYVRPHLVGPVFITDYPCSMIALAKRKADDPKKIASFQLLAAGAELLKAYNELNDPQDQRQRWLEEEDLAQKGNETAMKLDEDYLQALEYGMPPTAGWGMGIDRFTQFLTDQPTIKDVILFPAMRNESTNISGQTGLHNKLIVIGKIETINKHPNADKLQILTINVGTPDHLTIVCGATNIKAGDIVPVSLCGALVLTQEGTPMKIEKSKIRGEVSQGMLCSAIELGTGSDHTGIFLLSSELEKHLGQPVGKYIEK